MPALDPVIHVGPSPRFAGGIGASMVVLCEHSPVPATIVASWEPRGRIRQIRVAAQAAVAIARTPRRTVVHVHMASDGSALRKAVLMRIARLTGHTTVATIHGSGFEESTRAHPRLMRAALRQPQALFVLSPAMLAIAGRLAPDVPARLVCNPVEVDPAISPAGERAPTVVFAGEIGSRKGVDVLAKAWPLVLARVPEARLLMIGPQADAAPPTGPGVELLGSLPREQVRARLRGARVVALPSRAEALPMVLLEAMGSGTPFVATEVGDITRLISTGAGRAMPVDDHVALADELVELLTVRAAATRAGEAGWRACAAGFEAARVTADLVASYPRR